MHNPEPNDRLLFGFPEEWKAFRERHAMFLGRFPNMTNAVTSAFARTLQNTEPIEKFIFLYGRLCMEDFYEVMLCCGNGYGWGAMKLLRALYEKAVTLEYLNEHPEELQVFFDYHYVAQHKLLNSVTEVFGEGVLPDEVQEQTVAAFERVKEQFMISKCKKCDTKQLNHSWNKLNFVAMAKSTRNLGKFIHSAYYVPMRHTHSTAAALFERLDHGLEGIMFNPEPQRPQADTALRTAHTIVLEVLHIQQKRFTIPGFDHLLDQCSRDWMEIGGIDEEDRVPCTS